MLTPLGAHLSNLPVDVHIGKMILFGALFRCLDPILTIAAALSFKSPFIRPFGKEDEADAARARFRVHDSDFLTIYKAYDTWRQHLVDLRDKQKISASNLMRKMRKFCKDNFLSEQNLEMIEEMKQQYLGLLVSIGFVKTKVEANRYDIKRSGVRLCQVPDAYNEHAYSIPVINAALTAGLYPKMAEYLRQSKQIINKKMELQIHPSSMLFRREYSLASDFLVYNTVVMNNANGQMKDKVYMWETASIDPVAVILLSTGLDIKVTQMMK
jgi:ATP-dependent RNA helicase DHX29